MSKQEKAKKIIADVRGEMSDPNNEPFVWTETFLEVAEAYEELEQENKDLNHWQALCGCGQTAKSHGMYDGHSYTPINEACPYEQDLRDLQKKYALLEELLGRLALNAMRALRKTCELPESGCYEDTPGGQRSHVFQPEVTKLSDPVYSDYSMFSKEVQESIRETQRSAQKLMNILRTFT